MPGLEAAKAYVALVGAIATALLGTYGPDTKVGAVLVVVVAVSTAIATFAVPNRDPKALHQDQSVQPPHAGELGQGSVLYVLLIVLVVLVILAVLGLL